MNERDEIAREILPFLVDLFPGVSAELIINIMKIIFAAASVFLIIMALGAIIIRIIVRQNFKRYIKNLPVLGFLRNLEIDDSKKNLMEKLIMDCALLGTRIDLHTNRKNNSRNVSNLVYYFCLDNQIDDINLVSYTCAAMVYDVGFLAVNPVFFHAEVLSAKEKNKIKSHIMNSYSYFDFIPKELSDDFLAASYLHHENFDGTGFPEGLRGYEIPTIARMIRVAESYVALTSKRSYRKVFSKDEAIKELEKSGEKYDPVFLDGLKRKIR